MRSPLDIITSELLLLLEEKGYLPKLLEGQTSTAHLGNFEIMPTSHKLLQTSRTLLSVSGTILTANNADKALPCAAKPHLNTRSTLAITHIIMGHMCNHRHYLPAVKAVCLSYWGVERCIFKVQSAVLMLVRLAPLDDYVLREGIPAPDHKLIKEWHSLSKGALSNEQ
eukprot:1479550-Amphidinium_carterae.1